MAKQPLISVIVLNYNGQKYLTESIPSLLKLSYPNLEFIVVDNNSTDASLDYLNKFPNIRIVRNKKNLGYSFGKNIGVESAQGEYFLLLDNDIVINDPDVIDKLLQLSQDKKDKCFISIPCLDAGQSKTVGYGGFGYRYFLGGNKPQALATLRQHSYYRTSSLIGATIFGRKDNWETLGGFDTSQPFNIDDGDLGFRAWLMGFPCYVYAQIHTTHIGLATRTDTATWCWKYKYHFSGVMRVIIKNLVWYDSLVLGFIFIILEILKTLKQAIARKSFCPITSFLWSIGLFLIKLPQTFILRHKIQAQRVIKKDTFLFIQKPNF